MHQVYIDLIMSVLLEQFETEKNFLDEYLLISPEQWQKWKDGEKNLPSEAMQKVKNLFTDYEWMLTQKILRQTIIFPEKTKRCRCRVQANQNTHRAKMA